MMKQKPGTLYLIPTPIETGRIDTLPEKTLIRIHSLNHFIVENARTARRFLRAVNHPQAIDTMWIEEMERESTGVDLLAPLKEGNDVGIMSEAGLPCIADPGNVYVGEAHRIGANVVPESGPSSLFMALMGSGLEGQRFSFLGYLPAKRNELISKLREVERACDREKATQIWIETPYRNNQMMECIGEVIRGDRYFCIAAGLDSQKPLLQTKQVKQWKSTGWPEINKVPTVFLLY